MRDEYGNIVGASGEIVYMVRANDGTFYAHEKKDILHIPGVMFPGAEVGLSPVEAARQSIGAGMAAEEFAARFFGQGATTAGVIESDNEVTPDQARDMARQFSRLHGGKNKAHLPAVLPAKATWRATGVTNEQAQFLQTRQFSAATIASLMFQIDPSELGLSIGSSSGTLTYSNLEQRNVHKVQTTFLPWLVRLETALSALIRQQNRYIKINVNGLLRGDLKTRYESYSIGIASKFLLPNEARELEDMPPIDGGDKFAEPPAPAKADAAADQPTGADSEPQ